MKRLLSSLTAILILSAITASGAAPADKLASGFAWGTDIGGSIDLTGNDMSTINADAYFGYRNAVIDMAGIGAGINMMVSNSCRAFPVYAVFRSNFRRAPSLCFADLRIGAVFNNLEGSRSVTAFYTSPGIGFNLARGKSFNSYIIVSYLLNGMKPAAADSNNRLNMACLRLGISF